MKTTRKVVISAIVGLLAAFSAGQAQDVPAVSTNAPQTFLGKGMEAVSIFIAAPGGSNSMSKAEMFTAQLLKDTEVGTEQVFKIHDVEQNALAFTTLYVPKVCVWDYELPVLKYPTQTKLGVKYSYVPSWDEHDMGIGASTRVCKFVNNVLTSALKVTVGISFDTAGIFDEPAKAFRVGFGATVPIGN